MKPLITIVCASLAGALIAAGCNSGTGGPAFPPSNPFGTDPAPTTGNEPPGTGGIDRPPSTTTQPPPPTGTVEQLCTYDCQHIEALCPGGSGGSSCVGSCEQAAAYFPGCETQFKTYLSCVGGAPIDCANGNAQISGCDAQIAAVQSCAQGTAAAP
ncbi:MAG TPA: hypothetical protein VKQ32_21305 [Polyangia bacterium]|nr:hypothetical protein [Polyangia bacterium]